MTKRSAQNTIIQIAAFAVSYVRACDEYDQLGVLLESGEDVSERYHAAEARYEEARQAFFDIARAYNEAQDTA
jgi:hypothetical protein